MLILSLLSKGVFVLYSFSNFMQWTSAKISSFTQRDNLYAFKWGGFHLVRLHFVMKITMKMEFFYGVHECYNWKQLSLFLWQLNRYHSVAFFFFFNFLKWNLIWVVMNLQTRLNISAIIRWEFRLYGNDCKYVVYFYFNLSYS